MIRRSAATRHGAFALDRTLAARHAAFERYFAGVLPAGNALPARLHAAMRYSALAPGKRVRPLLALAAGEAIGLLAGDALLALAFEELARLERRGVPAPRVAEAVRVLARAAGSRELIAGQVLDLEAERRRPDARRVRAIHERKTGALIGAALELGAIAGGARGKSRQTLARLGRTIGLAFQIHDDLLNRGSSLARLGKRAGTDQARGKATWPAAVGEACAARDRERLFGRTRRAIERLGPQARPLAALVNAIARRER